MIQTEQVGAVTKFRLARTLVNRGYYWTAAYFVDGLLVDTGCHFSADKLCRALRRQHVHTIVNTHHHEDHIGNNRLFQDRFGAEIYAHPGALAFLEEPRRIGMQLYRRVVWNTPDPSRGRPVGDTVSTSRHSLQVIPAPGHSPDHICLYEPAAGLLFAGDIFCGKRVAYFRADEDFNLTLQSLKRLAALDIRTIYCGLKGVVEDGGKALKEKIRGMEELRDKALELRQKGLSPREIRRRLLGFENKMYTISGGHFSKQNVIDSILGKD
jgi:glyoxylase-like metal-dependent hydrolase (beta-lactamase superfamily II)